MLSKFPLAFAIGAFSVLLPFGNDGRAQVTPNDPGLSEQQYLGTINAANAWSIASDAFTSQADHIVIAVLDDGFDLDHPDLNFWVNANEIPNNGIDDDNNDYIDDVNGWDAVDSDGDIPTENHGTRVAGIIGALGNNNFGVAGVCWGVLIMPVRVDAITPSSVVAGYEYVLAQKRKYFETNGAAGAFIVATNLSQSLLNSTPSDYPNWCAMYDELGAEGILSVNAPYNRNREIGVSSPTPFNVLPALCSSEYLIVVTATTQADNLIEGDNATGSPWSQTHVDIAAPGQEIYSTASGGGFNYETGTSFAAPLVAGSIGLMYSAACDELITQSKESPQQVALELKNVLLSSTDPVGSLFLLIRRGRLNINRALISISEQQTLDRTITGTTSQNQEYPAIRDILVEHYVHNVESDIRCVAGRSITLAATVDIRPVGQGSAEFEVNPMRFECSIPFTPVSVSLATPPYSQCDGFTFCNAAAYGGLPPYTFHWESRATSESSWTVRSPSGNLLVVNGWYNDNFYVRVRVTDSNGSQAWSSTNLVNCIDGLAVEGGGSFRDAMQSQNSGVMSSRNPLTVFPNPVENMAHFVAKGGAQLSSVKIIDDQGRVVQEGGLALQVDGPFGYSTIDTSRLAAGCYLLSVECAGEAETARFIKVP